MSEAQMRKKWGERCSEYERGCVNCEAWKLFDKLGREPTEEELDAVYERHEDKQQPRE